MDAILKVRDLHVTFPTKQGPFDALSGVDLNLAMGERLALMGESGCGKSVLGHAVLGLLRGIATVRGSVDFDGKKLELLDDETLRLLRGSALALIPQSPNMAFNPVIRVGKQIDEMYTNTGVVAREEAKHRSLARLKEIGFERPEKIYTSFPHQLSGGMCERALIAMATALSPSLLVADEPTKGLDPSSKMDVLKLLRRESTGKSMILITHDHYAPMICDCIAIMYAGVILEIGPADRVMNDPYHPYTKGLWKALPQSGMRAIPGSMTLLRDGGCRFRERCDLRGKECSGPQYMRDVSNGHYVRCCRA
ncbi:MAG: ABC transporter ATP-binding protein [Methanomassiliicoccales archaeon]|jgi:peptide/nickel transport system ATP-binding protein